MSDNENHNLLSAEKSLYGPLYDQHFFEQYTTYLEIADRISSRRMLANTFFITLHTALLSAYAVAIKDDLLPRNLFGSLPLCALLLLCYVWWRLLLSYRQLSSGKFAIIRQIEKHLPLSLFDAEWTLLGRGRDSRRFLALTRLEVLVPLCFGVLYTLFGLSLLLRI
jgi:hypothetical protein